MIYFSLSDLFPAEMGAIRGFVKGAIFHRLGAAAHLASARSRGFAAPLRDIFRSARFLILVTRRMRDVQ